MEAGRRSYRGPRGRAAHAFGLGAYDAVWVTAQAYLAAGGCGHATALETAFVTAANSL
jgi:hypothetical protein